MGIISGNREKWRAAVPVAARAILEGVAGETLREFGYQTEGVGRPVGKLEGLGWRLHSRLLEPLVKFNTYPTDDTFLTIRELVKARMLRCLRSLR